jgi:hypothetical protein
MQRGEALLLRKHAKLLCKTKQEQPWMPSCAG